jgi:uncharacterized protein DUF4439
VFAGAAAGALLEERLAGQAAGVLTAFADDLGRQRRRLLTGARDLHLGHAAALRSADPTARDAAPAARVDGVGPAKGDSLRQALTGLARAEDRAAAAHRRNAVAAVGSSALLWASMGVAATSLGGAYRDDDAAVVAPAQPPRGLPPSTDVRAVQQLVAQLHAMVYGYQLAIGQLKVRSAGHQQALARLGGVRRLRDGLIRQLLARSAPVPAPAPAYVPSTRPTTPARAARLLQQMEVALAPYCGQWLAAAADPAARGSAYGALAATVATARAWDAPVARWPGWPA